MSDAPHTLSGPDLNRLCHRKKRYWDATFANKVAAVCFAKRQVQLRAYLCPYCYGYHLTKLV